MHKLGLLLLLFIQLSYAQGSFPENLAGKTFQYLGPNCFGVAMLANGALSSIRGVDLLEFESFIKLNCKSVRRPKRGDIGTFHNGQSFIHAFYYLGNDLVLEKTGVDYMGKTPIHLRDIGHTIYSFEASQECRRYGGGSRSCYNDLEYFRCQPTSPISRSRTLISLENEITKSFSEYLNIGHSPKSLQQLGELIHQYFSLIEELSDDDSMSRDHLEALKARLLSFEKQLLFIKN